MNSRCPLCRQRVNSVPMFVTKLIDLSGRYEDRWYATHVECVGDPSDADNLRKRSKLAERRIWGRKWRKYTVPAEVAMAMLAGKRVDH